MSPKRLRISEGEKEERCNSDPLNSLPDELIRLILFKITDPKTLFVSSLVSKRIASILSHSQSLSLLPGEILRLIFSTQRPWLEKIWYVPKLRLPVSGFEMKEVALMVSRDRNGGGCGGVWEEFEGSSDDALDGGFEDDEHGIFGEAMTQILTKHPLKTTYF